MTPNSSQANWHLIHHHHITKLFHLLNQNTMFIIDNTHFQNIHSFHHQKSIHTSFIIFSIPNNTITHTKSVLPLISNHIILKQSTIKGNKLRQHSLVNTVVFAFCFVFVVFFHLFSTNSVSRRSVNCPLFSASNYCSTKEYY